jgi:TorA maturation chaperone TorD
VSVANGVGPSTDPIEMLRAQQYNLLAVLLHQAPTPALLKVITGLKGDASPLGSAYSGLAQAAAAADSDELNREFLDLFIGVGRGELLPYASFYMTGFLHERPLVALRNDMAKLGVERADHLREPEDHISVLFELMAGFASRRFEVDFVGERCFFERHLMPWAPRFFSDLENAQYARFYRAVSTIGRLFLEVEAQAFAMDEDARL